MVAWGGPVATAVVEAAMVVAAVPVANPAVLAVEGNAAGRSRCSRDPTHTGWCRSLGLRHHKSGLLCGY